MKWRSQNIQMFNHARFIICVWQSPLLSESQAEAGHKVSHARHMTMVLVLCPGSIRCVETLGLYRLCAGKVSSPWLVASHCLSVLIREPSSTPTWPLPGLHYKPHNWSNPTFFIYLSAWAYSISFPPLVCKTCPFLQHSIPSTRHWYEQWGHTGTVRQIRYYHFSFFLIFLKSLFFRNSSAHL